MSESTTDTLQAAFARFHARDLAGAAQACQRILLAAPDQPDALHLLGVVRLTEGGAREAATLLERALKAKPEDAALLDHLGLAQLTLARHADAEASFRRALALGAGHGQVHMRLGLALGAQRRHAEALSALREAARIAPGDADVRLNLGNALVEAGETAEALACYRHALITHPGHPLAWFNIGMLHRREQRWDEALAAFRGALAAAPREPDIHNNMGAIHERQGRSDEAMDCYQRALAFDPRHVATLNNLGNLLAAQGRRDEALRRLQQALDINPRHVDTCINLGNLYVELGREGEARKLYEQALAVDASGFEAHFNLGRLLRLQGDRAAAIAHLQRALAAGAPRSRTLGELGGAHRDAGDLEQAATYYREALATDPDSVAVRYNLGETLKIAGRLEEAAAAYEQVLAREENHAPALAALAHVCQHLCRWDGIEALWGRLRGALAGPADGRISPFTSLSMPVTPAEQLACARRWAEAELGPVTATRDAAGFGFAGRPSNARLRVGYVSADFRRHALAYLTAELFELHDRERFEVFAYSCGPDDGSAIRSRIERGCEHFVDVEGETHALTAQRIYRDRIDVLVDLDGWTQGARTRTFALRPAPVQVSWLGYPGTSGAECIDYLIADSFVIPPESDCHYSERVVRIGGCYQINDRRREVAARPPTRGECSLPQRGFVFCCFNQAYKIAPDTFVLWMKLLHAVPGSVLWLAEANRWAVENLRRAAAAAGIAGERLVFAPRRPLPEYLAQYAVADLALDTFPYTSHTTASDALWMGCPLVTRVGDTFASRVAGSIVTAAGLPEMIVATREEYERVAIALARAPERLAELRLALGQRRETCALFDSPGRVRDLERVYEGMIEAWRRDDRSWPRQSG